MRRRVPWNIERISVAVAIDGVWKWKYDENGEVLFTPDGSIQREYTPVEDPELDKAQTLVEHAIGYNRNRGDTVTVQHLQFDRTEQFKAEDEVFRRQARVRQLVMYGLIGLAVLVIAFLVFRFCLPGSGAETETAGRRTCHGSIRQCVKLPSDPRRKRGSKSRCPSKSGPGWRCRRMRSIWPGNIPRMWPSLSVPG